jgi:quinol monooxygenase YgiN
MIETWGSLFLPLGERELISDRYKSKAAMGAHGNSKEFKAFQKKLADEDLVGGPMQLKLVKFVGGFASRL